MGKQHLSPAVFGEHATAWPDGLFTIRVENETDEQRLREAVKAEADRDARQERIGKLNRRLAELDA